MTALLLKLISSKISAAHYTESYCCLFKLAHWLLSSLGLQFWQYRNYTCIKWVTFLLIASKHAHIIVLKVHQSSCLGNLQLKSYIAPTLFLVIYVNSIVVRRFFVRCHIHCLLCKLLPITWRPADTLYCTLQRRDIILDWD